MSWFTLSEDHSGCLLQIGELNEAVHRLHIQVTGLEAEIKYEKIRSAQLLEDIERLHQDKAKLLEDLLIAAGVKMSEQQKLFLEREMSQEEKEPAYGGQARQWSYNNTTAALKDYNQDRRSVIAAMTEQLEREGLGVDG